jgi:hypothetical protein
LNPSGAQEISACEAGGGAAGARAGPPALKALRRASCQTWVSTHELSPSMLAF